MDPQTLKRLGELSRMLEAATSEYAELDEAAVRAKAAAEFAADRAFLGGEGSIEQRKAEARVETYRVRLDAELATAMVRHCQERIRTLRSQIEVGRSLNAALRSEFAAGGSVT